jgi:hypothetical protein
LAGGCLLLDLPGGIPWSQYPFILFFLGPPFPYLPVNSYLIPPNATPSQQLSSIRLIASTLSPRVSGSSPEEG